MINIQGIVYKIAEKPFYGKFPFKAVICGVKRNWRMSTRDQRAYNEFYSASREMLVWTNGHCKDQWRVRRDSDWSFFFADQSDCEAFIHQFHKDLRFIAGPKNEHHRERMLASPKLLVRRSLFKQRFPYRAHVRNDYLYGPQGESLRNWIDTQAAGVDLELNSGLLAWYKNTNIDRWSTKTIYFLDESASIMLKLMLGDNLSQIEKVITIDEFSKQEASDQEDA